MKYYISKIHDPYFNLALEEVLFKDFNDTILYLWQNDNTIVVGKNQNTFEEINLEEVEKQNIRVVRRLTGGGSVYHDLGNLNFSILTNVTDGALYDYSSFLKPVIKALKSFNIDAKIQGRNDIEVNGYKISGNAQMMSNNRVLHHGTLLINSDLSKLSKVLKVSKTKLKSKSIKSIKSRVANLSNLTTSDINIDLLENKIIEEYCSNNSKKLRINDSQLKKINKLKNEKYSSFKWVYEESPKSDFTNEIKYTCGTIKVEFNIEKGNIKNIHFTGDFLDKRDIDEVVKQLDNTKYQKKDLKEKLSEIKISNYLKNVNSSEFVKLFFD